MGVIEGENRPLTMPQPDNANDSAAIEVFARKRYRDRSPSRFALDIRFAVPAGITILFGSSGAGKTTTLGCIAGLVTPDDGRIRVGSRVLFDAAAHIDVDVSRRSVGYVFQDLALFPHLNVERNVRYGLRGLAVTDHQGLYGVVRFAKAARAAGLRPIVGIEIELLDAAVPDAAGVVIPARRSSSRGGRGPAIRIGPFSRPAEGRPDRPRAGRARRAGAGRKPLEAGDPGLKPALLALVEPGARGARESPLQWTTKPTRNLAAELTRQGHRAGPDTVARLLREESFSLQGNAKTAEGGRHPGRDAQFRYISGQAMAFQAAGDPVISVDAKKKQNVGRYKNGGREWRPKGQPEPVNVYDFIDKELGKVTPYGVYDITANAGWVPVGTDHDTAEFAVATIATWWEKAGRAAYPGARRLLITADGGGSNGYRTRLWKTGLAKLADATGLEITVCHFPPGTSKWNKIEHRLFSHISMNWRGRPLTSHEVIVRTIAATTTRTGLTVTAELDTGSYPKGIKITDEQMKGLDKRALRRHEFHGEWNYTLIPADGDTRNLLIGPHFVWSIVPRAGFWPIWVIVPWGLGLAFHAWYAFGSKPITDADIRREMRKHGNGTS